MEIFELIYNDNGIIETVELEHEPVGYDAVDFQFNQEEGRYGRDWHMVGNGLIPLEITKHVHYEAFLLIEKAYEKYDFEADVLFRLTDGQEVFEGNVEFTEIEYNGQDIFKIKFQ